MSSPKNHCIFSIDKEKHFVRIQCEINLSKNHTLYVSKWRPGRYEFGDFAKNIKSLKAFDSEKHEISLIKTERNAWSLQNFKGGTVYLEYTYYAKELNAGSTYTDGNFLFINPVNCVLFNDEIEGRAWEINLDVPENWQLAGNQTGEKSFYIENYNRFADTPLLASPNLNLFVYTVEDIQFKIWFKEQLNIPSEQLINDFK